MHPLEPVPLQLSEERLQNQPLSVHAPVHALTQTEPDEAPEIVTDRPDVTDAATVVPKGSFLAENGSTWTLDHRRHYLDIPESVWRVGVLERTELRLWIPDYIWSQTRKNTPSGLQDMAVGFKQQLGPLPGKIDLAVIGGLSLPMGAFRLSSHHVDPFVKFPWSRKLTDRWSVGGMFSVFYPTEDHRRNLTLEPTFYIERAMSRNTDLFLEYAGDYVSIGTARQLIHMGGAWRPRPNQQLDFHMGFGLNSATPNFLIGVGYSFQINNLGFKKSNR